MAKWETEYGIDLDLIIEGYDETAIKALEAAAPIQVEATKRAIRSVMKHDGESELIESIEAKKPRKNRNGATQVNITPTGISSKGYYYPLDGKGGHYYKRSYPVSNALKAVWLENGVAGRQPAKHWLQKASNDAEVQIQAKIQEVFDEEMARRMQ